MEHERDAHAHRHGEVVVVRHHPARPLEDVQRASRQDAGQAVLLVPRDALGQQATVGLGEQLEVVVEASTTSWD